MKRQGQGQGHGEREAVAGTGRCQVCSGLRRDVIHLRSLASTIYIPWCLVLLYKWIYRHVTSRHVRKGGEDDMTGKFSGFMVYGL